MQALSRPGLASFAPMAAPISFGQLGLPNLLQTLQPQQQQAGGEDIGDRDMSDPLGPSPILFGRDEIMALLQGRGRWSPYGPGGGGWKRPFDNEFDMYSL